MIEKTRAMLHLPHATCVAGAAITRNGRLCPCLAADFGVTVL
jgi:hypothetical protein